MVKTNRPGWPKNGGKKKKKHVKTCKNMFLNRFERFGWVLGHLWNDTGKISWPKMTPNGFKTC